MTTGPEDTPYFQGQSKKEESWGFGTPRGALLHRLLSMSRPSRVHCSPSEGNGDTCSPW